MDADHVGGVEEQASPAGDPGGQNSRHQQHPKLETPRGLQQEHHYAGAAASLGFPSGGEEYQVGSAAWHSPTPHKDGLQPVPNLKDSLSPSSAESAQYAARPMQLPVEHPQEEDFLRSLASPGGLGRGTQMRYLNTMMMQPDGSQRLGPRALYSEEEAMAYHGGYPGRDPAGRVRNSMQPPAMPSDMHGPGMPAGVGGSPHRRMGGHMHGHAADGSPHTLVGHEEFREPGRMGASPMTPGASLQRSASEGIMRTAGQMAGHHRSGSGGSLQEERLLSRLGPEQPSNLLNPRGGDSPDFAMIYAFLGSMFDPVCSMINHYDVLTQMCDVDRETSLLLLTNISANLDSHGQEIFDRYLHSALQVQPPKRNHDGLSPL